MFKILKLFYWSMKKRAGRYTLLQSFLKDIPGEYGPEMRRRFYRKYFGKMGRDVTIRTGVQIFNVNKLSVGDCCHIGIDNMLQAGGGIEIGNHVILGPSVKIWSINHKFDNLEKPLMEQGYEYKKVVLGDKCWIGANVFIMPGANIGEGVIISAGAIVGGKTIPPYKILAGNPARVIGTREQPPAVEEEPSDRAPSSTETGRK